MIARWETQTRWYEAGIVRDLFGVWTLVRAWGGKGSRRYGGRIDAMDSEAAVLARIETLDKERRRRKPPYRRIV